jgi:cytochrome c-type biogenesis protein CcmE
LRELATDLRDQTVASGPALRTVVDMTRAVDPARRRRIRLVAALSAALLLAAALAYTTFTAASDAVTPSQLVAKASPGRTYQLTGKVAPHSVHRQGNTLRFAVRDRNGRGPAVPVFYRGTVPDPFREGREVIVTGQMADGTFVGTKDSLITKCPSKFTTKTPSGRTT